MEYLKVRWVHNDSEDPVLLLSELDTDRYEVRKIEIYADGRMGFATGDEESQGSVLSEKTIPPSATIAADPQFVVQALSAQEFEQAWAAARSGSRWQL